MRKRLACGLIAFSLLGLAACGGGGPNVATQTAIVLVVGTSPLVTEAPPSVTPEASTATAAPEASATTPPAATEAATTDATLAVVTGDPLLRTYRSMVAIQMNAALVGETVAQVQAGRIDPEEMPVAALALGALTQSVDEALPGVAAPPELATQWQAALELHNEVKDLGARWLLGVVDVDDVNAAMGPIQTELERLVAEAEVVVGAEYGVSAAELTEHRVRLVAAVGGVFE